MHRSKSWSLGRVPHSVHVVALAVWVLLIYLDQTARPISIGKWKYWQLPPLVLSLCMGTSWPPLALATRYGHAFKKTCNTKTHTYKHTSTCTWQTQKVKRSIRQTQKVKRSIHVLDSNWAMSNIKDGSCLIVTKTHSYKYKCTIAHAHGISKGQTEHTCPICTLSNEQLGPLHIPSDFASLFYPLTFFSCIDSSFIGNWHLSWNCQFSNILCLGLGWTRFLCYFVCFWCSLTVLVSGQSLSAKGFLSGKRRYSYERWTVGGP